MDNASLTSSSVGGTAGMIAFTKALVILEDFPAIDNYMYKGVHHFKSIIFRVCVVLPLTILMK